MKPIAALPAACSIVATFALAAGPTPVTLKTTEFGRGPTIVLLHGMGSARTVWLPTAKKLLPSHHVVMMDLPGHGDSPLPDPFSLEAAAEAVAQALGSQKAESTVVVGQGMGAMIALMAVSAHPERVRGVVMLDGSLKTEQPIPEQQQAYFLQYMEENYDQVLKMIYGRMGRDSAQSMALHAQAAQVPPATIKAYMKAALNADQSKALKGLKPRFLYVATEKRWPADKSWSTVSKQWGIDGIDSTRAVRLANCGPMVASEQPDSLAAIFKNFSAQALAKK